MCDAVALTCTTGGITFTVTIATWIYVFRFQPPIIWLGIGPVTGVGTDYVDTGSGDRNWNTWYPICCIGIRGWVTTCSYPGGDICVEYANRGWDLVVSSGGYQSSSASACFISLNRCFLFNVGAWGDRASMERSAIIESYVFRNYEVRCRGCFIGLEYSYSLLITNVASDSFWYT